MSRTGIAGAAKRLEELTDHPAVTVHRLLGAQGARELATASQRVEPAKLLAAEHVFRTPDLDSTLAHLLGRKVASTRG